MRPSKGRPTPKAEQTSAKPRQAPSTREPGRAASKRGSRMGLSACSHQRTRSHLRTVNRTTTVNENDRKAAMAEEMVTLQTQVQIDALVRKIAKRAYPPVFVVCSYRVVVLRVAARLLHTYSSSGSS